MKSNASVAGPARRTRRILVVDDNPSIHTDFRKILCPGSPAPGRNLEALEASLFGPPSQPPATRGSPLEFSVDFASQGQGGLEAVRRGMKAKTPYALAFIDMRMPPGWDGVETAFHIWEEDPAIQIVICSAYSDYSWNEVVQRLNNRPGLRLLQSPSTPRMSSIWPGR
jgi:CheY-like chemotaxis protein